MGNKKPEGVAETRSGRLGRIHSQSIKRKTGGGGGNEGGRKIGKAIGEMGWMP